MFLPYWLSVIILSLALYGLWHFCRDMCGLWSSPMPGRPLTVSLLIIVRNAEDIVEGQVRGLLHQTVFTSPWQEVVIVDHGSDDLTPAILTRLAALHPLLKIVCLTVAARPVAEAIAFCQGDIVQVLDMETRVAPAEWEAAIQRLIRG